jgi:hypothetical protein
MVQMVTLGRMVVSHFLSYCNKNDTIYGTLWIPHSFHFSQIKPEVQAVEDCIENQLQVLQILKGNLTMAQNHMKQQVDQHCSERIFEVVDWVFLILQP